MLAVKNNMTMEITNPEMRIVRSDQKIKPRDAKLNRMKIKQANVRERREKRRRSIGGRKRRIFQEVAQ